MKRNNIIDINYNNMHNITTKFPFQRQGATMDFYEFFKTAADQPLEATLQKLVAWRLDSGQPIIYFRVDGDGFAHLPDKATNLHFGAESHLAGLNAKRAAIEAWTPDEAQAENDAASSRAEEFVREGVDIHQPMIELAERLMATLIRWRPASSDASVYLQLELFRARLIVQLREARDWAERRQEGWTSYYTPMTAEQYQQAELDKLTAEIIKEEATIAHMYSEATRQLPFLKAIRDQLLHHTLTA